MKLQCTACNNVHVYDIARAEKLAKGLLQCSSPVLESAVSNESFV